MGEESEVEEAREQLASEEEARQELVRKEAKRQEVERNEERRQDEARNGQEEEKPEELMLGNREEERGGVSYGTEKRNTQIDLEGLLSLGGANEVILGNLNQTQGEQL